MKNPHNSEEKDQDLREFFGQMKQEEASLPVPDLEEMLDGSSERSGKPVAWAFAAAAALLIIGIGAYQVFFFTASTPAQSMEIVISYESPAGEMEDELQLEGMDQWQSETDIFLTGL